MASTFCACRDCFDTASTSNGKPALCLLCKDAECEISYGKYGADSPLPWSLFCQREDAYSG